jgi:hypothetical protein
MWSYLAENWPSVRSRRANFMLGRLQVSQRCAVLLLMPASAAAWAVGRRRAHKHRVCSKLRSLTQRDNDMAASKRALEGTNRVERSQSQRPATAKAPAPRKLNRSKWYRKSYPTPEKR